MTVSDDACNKQSENKKMGFRQMMLFTRLKVTS